MEEAKEKHISGWAKKRMKEVEAQKKLEKVRKELTKEEELRKSNPALLEAWEKYQVLLNLSKR